MGESILSVKHALETGQQCSFETSPRRKRQRLGGLEGVRTSTRKGSRLTFRRRVNPQAARKRAKGVR